MSSEPRPTEAEKLAAEPSANPLSAFYVDSAARPRNVLSEWRRREIRSFDEADRSSAISSLDSCDPYRQRTLKLTHAASTAKSNALAATVFGWAGEVVRTDARRDHDWQFNSAHDAAATFESLCRAYAPAVDLKKSRRRGLNLLGLAILWLWHGRGLEIVPALGILRAHLRGRRKSEPTLKQVARNLVLVVTRSPVMLARIQSLADVAWICKFELDTLNGQISALKREQELAAKRIQLQSVEINSLRVSLADLEKDLADRTEDLKAGHARLRDAEALASHKETELRGRGAGFLANVSERFIADALQAAAAEPPHIAVVKERLEVAVEEIRKEAQWLRSSG